jgi:hypothetical protein
MNFRYALSSRQSAFFVPLAFVPRDAPNQFFVLRQKDVNSLIRFELKRLKRPDNYPVTGFTWKQALKHNDKWGILPK